MEVGYPNLVTGWATLLAGVIGGALLGIGFQRDEYLGGYASLRRRLYRLGHIACFGLGFLNLVYFLTCSVKNTLRDPTASWLFVVGGVTMPLCCLLVAHAPRAKPVFAIPVVCIGFACALVLNLAVQRP